MRHYPSSFTLLTLEIKDHNRQTVWLGRHPAEKISVGPKGQLKRFRNPLWSARAKAGLTGSITILDSGTKVWSSELLCPY